MLIACSVATQAALEGIVMKICIVGAGSIGGYVGVKLALSGEDVTLVARGANFQAIQRDGMKLISHDGGEQCVRNIKVASRIADAGEQDVIILAMKAHQVEAVAADIEAICHEKTVIVPMQNGIPWWYFQKLPVGMPPELEGTLVRSVDPRGVISAAIDPARIIGCVVYPACELVAPGVVRHIEGERFPLGELDGSESERVKALAAVFERAGLKSPVLPNVRAEIWLKLWGNLTFNPLSALTHSTLQDICRFPLTRELAASMMREAEAVANKLGVTLRVTLEKRIAGAEKVGKHKTSMLQDIEAGRDPEIDALVGAVIELGRIAGSPTPHIEAVFAMVKLLGQTMKEERVYIRAQPLAA
jgi:2-dehydropantoate 2-reductase